MSFVIYDVETTGLAKRFDQIIQFAALRTDSALRVTGQFQSRCRLMPHIVPSPEAMALTGLGISRLVDKSLPSHYSMITEVRRILESWCPTVFLGFNSLSFDEEFLRQAFYQCLFDPYLTNTRGNARADVLNLCRTAAALRPDVMKPGVDAEDGISFRLEALAEANGVETASSHDARADACTTLELCRIIKSGAPELWSQFQWSSRKSNIESFIAREQAFLMTETFGNQLRARVVTLVGTHDEIGIRHYCLDMETDIEVLRRMPEAELTRACMEAAGPVVTLRSNASPILWALDDLPKAGLAPVENQDEILEKVARLRADKPFLERLRRTAEAAEEVYPPSEHVEEQLYESGFPPPQDKSLMQRFQVSSWEKRMGLARQLVDKRYRRLALRLIYLERPDLLSTERRRAAAQEVRKRLAAFPDSNVPWRTAPLALQEAKCLLSEEPDGDQLVKQSEYLDYLNQLAGALRTPISDEN